jgi:hypothetical protein
MDYIYVLTDTCNNLLTPDALNIFNEVLLYIRILAPAILILFIAIDLVKVVISNENPGKNTINKIVKRCIATALLFFVPTLISIILNIGDINKTLAVDPLCLSAKGTESKAENIYEMFGLGDGKYYPTDKIDEMVEENKKKQQSANTESISQRTTTESESTFGTCDPSKRCRKTVTIKGRTYDSYMQHDFADVGFSGQNISVAGCSCVAFVQAASGFDRSLTIFKGATMFKDRTFDGIASALRQMGIPYSSIIYYNSNDYENTANGKSRAQAVVDQVRAHLNQGKPAIAMTMGGPYSGSQPHFITLFGEDENGNLITGNSRKEVGSLEELVANSLRGGRKGFMLVG